MQWRYELLSQLNSGVGVGVAFSSAAAAEDADPLESWVHDFSLHLHGVVHWVLEFLRETNKIFKQSKAKQMSKSAEGGGKYTKRSTHSIVYLDPISPQKVKYITHTKTVYLLFS